MDTNILAHPDIDPENIALSARLPGELGAIPHDDGIQNEHPAPEADERLPTSQLTPSKRRGMLLAGVAVAAVVAVGAGVFLLSPYDHVYPVPRLASTARNAAALPDVKLPAVLAPLASLANVTLPPASLPARRDRYAAKPRQAEVAELLALHPAAKDHGGGAVSVNETLLAGQAERAPATQSPVPANPPPIASSAKANRSDVPGGYVPSEPGAIALPARPRDATAAILAAIPSPATTADKLAPAVIPVPAPAAATAAAPVPPVLAGSPAADPIAVAHDLRAAPMTAQDQVQVLGLVTEMASVVKHLRQQNAQLRTDLGKSSADTAARLADYERRLALAEARSAVTAANDTANPAPVEQAVDPAPIVARPVSIRRAMAVMPAVRGSTTPKSYRVQAASRVLHCWPRSSAAAAKAHKCRSSSATPFPIMAASNPSRRRGQSGS